jgi:hypothetical protein
VISYFPSYKPTKEEYESTDLDLCLDLTYENPEWDPSSPMFGKQENAMLDSSGRLIDRGHIRRQVATLSIMDETFYDLNVALQRTTYVSTMKSIKPRYAIQPAIPAKNWNIGLKVAQRTLDATLQ